MNMLFYQILLVVFAALFTVASFGESRQSSRYADHIMTKKSSVKCEKYHWFLCSLFFTISILLFCAYSTTF